MFLECHLLETLYVLCDSSCSFFFFSLLSTSRPTRFLMSSSYLLCSLPVLGFWTQFQHSIGQPIRVLSCHLADPLYRLLLCFEMTHHFFLLLVLRLYSSASFAAGAPEPDQPWLELHPLKQLCTTLLLIAPFCASLEVNLNSCNYT